MDEPRRLGVARHCEAHLLGLEMEFAASGCELTFIYLRQKRPVCVRHSQVKKELKANVLVLVECWFASFIVAVDLEKHWPGARPG